MKKIPNAHIKNLIFSFRSLQVMIDKDLANLYEVETKVLNQAVKRNEERFPEDFRFQLRDTHKLKDLSNPKGILIVGREEEMKNKRKQELKSARNKNSSRIEIRTYDSFKRIIKEQIEFRKNPPKNNGFNIFLNR